MKTEVKTGGFNNPEEGNVIEALKSSLSLSGRLKLYSRMALGIAGVYVSASKELLGDGGPIIAGKKYSEGVRHLRANIVYDAVQSDPELFNPAVILEDAGPVS